MTEQVRDAGRARPGARRRDQGRRPAARWSLAVVAFPQVFTNPSVTNYGVFALIYVTAAIAWNIFSGNTGYISLGQAVFFGSGAYAMGIAAQRLARQRHHGLRAAPAQRGGRRADRGSVRR